MDTLKTKLQNYLETMERLDNQEEKYEKQSEASDPTTKEDIINMLNSSEAVCSPRKSILITDEQETEYIDILETAIVKCNELERVYTDLSIVSRFSFMKEIYDLTDSVRKAISSDYNYTERSFLRILNDVVLRRTNQLTAKLAGVDNWY